MPTNPGFAISARDARSLLSAMTREPRPGPRPLLILGGWRAPALLPATLARVLRRVVGLPSERVACVSFLAAHSIPDAAQRARATLRRLGWDAGPVDIVGISMGGLVARTLAAGLEGHEPHTIHHLFTLATPHRGARLATVLRPDAAARDMRPGSPFLHALDEAWSRGRRPHETRAYALLRDWWVGATRTMPPGHGVHWVDPTPEAFLLSHFLISRDPRIVADIARQLRGEPPLAMHADEPPID